MQVAKCPSVMGEHEAAESSHGLLHDQRGVIYVELVVLVAGAVLVAGLLGGAGFLLLSSRFERITEVISSGSP